jgi:hypothetical protein
MDQRTAVLLALGAGVLAGATGTLMVHPRPVAPPSGASAEPIQTSDLDDDESLAIANSNLVKSLQDCNRRLTAAGQKPVPPPPVAAAPTASIDFGSRQRRLLTAEGWAHLAEQGAVPFRIPCLREPPFAPSPEQLDHLGLAAGDGEWIREVYAKSNERVTAQVKPLCARVVGSEQAANLGAIECMDAVIDNAGQDDPQKMRQALVRVGEVQAGKRPAPSGEALEPIEAMMLALARETSAFEADLTTRFGPEEALRIVASRNFCMERRTVQAPKVGQ